MEYRITERARRQWNDFPSLVEAHRDRHLIPVKPPAPVFEPRPCAKCRKTFKPTLKRRLLCAFCFAGGDSEMRR